MKQRLLLVVTLAAFAAGCAQETAKPEVVRPVRTVTVDAARADGWTLPGEVRARYETRLAFRLPGQMLERRVEIGQRVAAGHVIASIDARDAGLAESQARAQLAQAESQAALAEADLKRFAELRNRNFISQAEYDRREAQARQLKGWLGFFDQLLANDCAQLASVRELFSLDTDPDHEVTQQFRELAAAFEKRVDEKSDVPRLALPTPGKLPRIEDPSEERSTSGVAAEVANG